MEKTMELDDLDPSDGEIEAPAINGFQKYGSIENLSTKKFLKTLNVEGIGMPVFKSKKKFSEEKCQIDTNVSCRRRSFNNSFHKFKLIFLLKLVINKNLLIRFLSL